MLSPAQDQLRARTRAFAREVVGPRRLEAYDNAPFLKEMVGLMGREGLLRTMVPKSRGGDEMGTMGGVLVVEELARESPAVAIAAMNQMLFPLNMLMNPVATERWFEAAVAGETFCAAAFTDPVGIANYAEHPEIAKQDGGDYVVNCSRWYVTLGTVADVIGVGGLYDNSMHMFWIDTTQSGVRVVPEPKMGIGAPWGFFELTDVRVPSELVNDMSFLVKDRELVNVSGAGTASTHFISALCLGLAEGVWDKTESFLRERTVRHEPLASMQALQHKMVRMRQDIEAGRSMLYDASQLVDAGRGDGVLDHLLKPFVSEMAVDVAQQCVTLHGGQGYLRSTGIEVYLRDAIGGLIAECTSEMHYSTVATIMGFPNARPGAF